MRGCSTAAAFAMSSSGAQKHWLAKLSSQVATVGLAGRQWVVRFFLLSSPRWSLALEKSGLSENERLQVAMSWTTWTNTA